MSPFEADIGYIPRTLNNLLTSTVPTQSDLPHAAYVEHLQERFIEANHFLHLTNTTLSQRQANADHSHLPSFTPGEHVLVLSEVIKNRVNMKRPKDKWKSTYEGPFKIIERLSDFVYKIDLPSSIKSHPNINIEFLRKYTPSNPDTFLERNQTEPIPVDCNGEPEFVVHSIVAFKLKGNTRYYLTKWFGYPDCTMEWCHYTIL
jgi:hypothetical protein